MTKLVRPIRARVVCDVYTCSNIAEFEVGHEFTPAAATHLCRDCLRSVYDEAHQIFAEETARTAELAAAEAVQAGNAVAVAQAENDDTEEAKQLEAVVAETVSGQEGQKQEDAAGNAVSKTKPAVRNNRAKAAAK